MKKLTNYQRTILKHYFIAALWSSTGPDDEPLDRDYGPEDISLKTAKQAVKDVKAFDDACPDYGTLDFEQVGHDLWLTRNRHGTGFWDRGLPKKLGNSLTKKAHDLGELYATIGDNGKVYFE